MTSSTNRASYRIFLLPQSKHGRAYAYDAGNSKRDAEHVLNDFDCQGQAACLVGEDNSGVRCVAYNLTAHESDVEPYVDFDDNVWGFDKENVFVLPN
jgi:hypothetical protein